MSRPGANILECQATDCAYNHDGTCRTIAITVGGPDPLCDTFVSADVKGGVLNATAKVGACKVGNCAHNERLECMVGAIRVVYQNGRALCALYQGRI
jgi:hypothetical protein